MSTPSTTQSNPLPDQQIVDRLRHAQVAIRSDVKVSRHLFRSRPAYVVHDPVCFQSHRFSRTNYEILSSLQADRTLESIFDSLCERKILERSEEVDFYRFILDLQVRGLLNLPVTDSDGLYRRFQMRQKMAKSFSPMKLLFLKIPLVNPNRMLDRTVRFAKPLFTKAFFVLWCVLALMSLGILINRWEEFSIPFANLLATRNLLLMAVVLTALKFWHELGHAYACKVNGGDVPDMGAIFIVSLPCAYVDVSSSWCFSRKRDRLIVALGGIYFESLAAILAIFVWALTENSLINAAAHATVVLATITTLLFNANPLMKFDGYYVLSDLIGIPNLRDRSTRQIKSLGKKWLLGLEVAADRTSWSEKFWLTFYGIASFFYRIWLVFSISIMVSSKFFLLGIMVAISYIWSTGVGAFKELVQYLWFASECNPVRPRAIAVSLLLFIVLPVMFLLIPVPGGVVADGQLGHESEQVIRAPVNVFVDSIAIAPNQTVEVGDKILKLRSDQLSRKWKLATVNLALQKTQFWAVQNRSPQEKDIGRIKLAAAKEELQTTEQLCHDLEPRAAIQGRVTRLLSPLDQGNYFPAGVELARITGGPRVVRLLMTEEQLNAVKPQAHQKVTCRFQGCAARSFSGVVNKIQPAGSREIKLKNLTHIAGGDIVVNPHDERARQPYFEVTVSLEQEPPEWIVDRSFARVRFQRKYESMAMYSFRHLRKLITNLYTHKK